MKLAEYLAKMQPWNSEPQYQSNTHKLRCQPTPYLLCPKVVAPKRWVQSSRDIRSYGAKMCVSMLWSSYRWQSMSVSWKRVNLENVINILDKWVVVPFLKLSKPSITLIFSERKCNFDNFWPWKISTHYRVKGKMLNNRQLGSCVLLHFWSSEALKK